MQMPWTTVETFLMRDRTLGGRQWDHYVRS
nr:MAG TPA: hypothetical protein [Caudoviricetes sp.]